MRYATTHEHRRSKMSKFRKMDSAAYGSNDLVRPKRREDVLCRNGRMMFWWAFGSFMSA